jgi:threonine synthase
VTDDEIREAATLLATTEGVLVEPAGGVVVATAKQLASRGVFHSGETVVLYLTGNGYKGGPEESALRPVIDADADAFRLAYEEVLA